MKVQDRINNFKKKYNFEPEAFEVCPKWDYCSCNKCPLHKNYSKLKIEPDDRCKKCKCPKPVRKQIGGHFKLKSLGLTLKEIDNMKKSIRMKKEFSFTRRKILKTPQNANQEEEDDTNTTS